MRTPETDAKAEAVRHFLVGKNVVVLEHHYADQSQSRDDPDYVRLKQREWYYRYLIQDKTGATEIRVTLDAMRAAEVDPLGRLVLAARQRKARGEVGTAWVELLEGQPMMSLEQ